MNEVKPYQKVILVGMLGLIVLALDYYRVACCKTDFGCIKCQSYLEHYGWS